MAISGQSGLFKFISQGRNGIIVESMIDGKRTHVSASAKVSTLSDISIYTHDGEKPLKEVLELIKSKEGGAQTISHKSSNEELKHFFNQLLPDYDSERVYASDIKKVVAWYNQLQSLGMLDFSDEEPEKVEELAGDPLEKEAVGDEKPADSKKTQTKKVAAGEKKPAAKKQAQVKVKSAPAKDTVAKKRIQQKKT